MSGPSLNRSPSGIPQPPLASYGFLKTAIGNDEFDKLSQPERSCRVHEGVLLKSNEGQDEHHQEQKYIHKYWVDEKHHKSCWMVLAKGLSISSGDNSEYWKWIDEEEKCCKGLEKILIAKLVQVWGLAISGTCKTTTLSSMTVYQVDIMVKLSSENHGWEAPVNLSLTLPDGHKQEREEYLGRLDWQEDKWKPIKIGTFETTPRTVGEISFSLTQTGGHRKSGLLVKGVQLTPLS